ncbi:orm1-like protein 2 [Citrus sinensis]|nr:orm1-like protein 2 [Citrus sinensis]
MYVRTVPPTDLNRNTEWFTYPGVWTTYLSILFISWLLVLSLFNCSSGMAWTLVHLSHFFVTYHFFHWKKGTPFADDQGIYNGLTWWEQIDNGKQLTRNRKFLTVVPVVLSYEFIIVSGLRISITENFSVVQGASHNFYHRHLSTHLACQVGFLYNRKMKLYRNLKGMSIGDCF